MQEGANVLLAKQVLAFLKVDTLKRVIPQVISSFLMYVYKRQLSYVFFTDVLLHAMVQSEKHEDELRRSGSHKTYYEDVARTCYRLDAIYNHRSWRMKQYSPSPAPKSKTTLTFAMTLTLAALLANIRVLYVSPP